MFSKTLQKLKKSTVAGLLMKLLKIKKNDIYGKIPFHALSYFANSFSQYHTTLRNRIRLLIRFYNQ